jgi:predicted phosphoribosyltransferase
MAGTERRDAGRRLAEELRAVRWGDPPLVLAISPGAAPVAFEIARALHAELDLLEVRPFEVGGREIGAVASGGVRVVHADVKDALGVDDDAVEASAAAVLEDIRRREHGWRRRHPRATMGGRTAILVTDIVGPDARMDAAVLVARVMGAAQVVAAAAVGASALVRQLRDDADGLFCLAQTDDTADLDTMLGGEPPDDDALRELLERAEEWRAPVPV